MSYRSRPSHFVQVCAVAAGLALDACVAAAADGGWPGEPGIQQRIDAAMRRADEAIARAAVQVDQALAKPWTGDVLADLDIDFADLPSLAFVAGEFGHAREIVKNAPYTAKAINESIQVLSDGNRIVKRSTTLLARDTYGRTRQERDSPRGKRIYIFDPISSKSYVLDPGAKLAVRIPRAPAPPAPLPPMPPIPPAVPEPPRAPMPPGSDLQTPRVIVAPHDERVFVRRGRDSGHAGDDREDVRVEIVRIGRDDAAGAPIPEPVPPVLLPLLPPGTGTTTDLGTRDFNGVKAQGTRTMHTIAAGAIGNERPIVVTSERWFSPELQLVVYAKTSDPRTGDTIYRLDDLRRGEPPADLFRVPDEYSVRPRHG